MNFFVLVLGLRLQRYSTNKKRYSPKIFLQSIDLFSQPKLAEKKMEKMKDKCHPIPSRDFTNFDKHPSFSGIFPWENKLIYLFVFVKYLCNCSLKRRIKNFKKHISILAIVNYRKMDASPPWKTFCSKMTRLSVCQANQFNMRYTNWGLRKEPLAAVRVRGAKLLALGLFLWFKKNGHFNAIWITFRCFVLQPFKEQNCKNPRSLDNIKLPNPLSPLYYLQV